MHSPHPGGLLIPLEYKYVIASLLPIAWLLLGQSLVVGRFRKRAGIAYPQLYAEKTEAQASKDAHRFNCAQRAHQNTLELAPVMFIITLVSGINHPKFAAGTCLLWVASRIVYTRGYVTGDPSQRTGILYHLTTLSVLSLLFVSTYHAIVHWVLV